MPDKTCVAVQKRTTRSLLFCPLPFFHLILKTGHMSSFTLASRNRENAMTALTDRKAPNGIVLHSVAGYDWLGLVCDIRQGAALSRETSRPGAPCLWRVCPRCGVRDRNACYLRQPCCRGRRKGLRYRRLAGDD